MIRVCCSKYHSGEKVFGEKEPLSDKGETHGFCDSCMKAELKEIRRELKLMNTEAAKVALKEVEDMIGG